MQDLNTMLFGQAGMEDPPPPQPDFSTQNLKAFKLIWHMSTMEIVLAPIVDLKTNVRIHSAEYFYLFTVD